MKKEGMKGYDAVLMDYCHNPVIYPILTHHP